MMLRYLAFTTAAVVLLSACSSNGTPEDAKLPPAKQLEAYRAERAKLDQKIKALEARLGKSARTDGSAPVTEFIAKRGPFDHFVVVKGTVESRSSASIAPKTSGQLVSLHVTNGQMVKKGDILAELDAEIIHRGLDEITTQLEFATTLFQKQERIFNQKAGSEIQYLQAKTNKEALEKKLASLKEQLALTRITAPVSGYVDGLVPRNGELVMAGMPIMTIVNTSDMRVVADIAETYVNTVSSGDPATVMFAEIGDSVKTRLGNVARNINAVSRTFRVEIPVTTLSAKLRPNSTCNISINDVTTPKAIAIPLEAIIRQNDKAFVYVISNNVATKREIQTGMVSNAMVEVVHGVNDDDHVVVRGATNLAEGQRVSVIQ